MDVRVNTGMFGDGAPHQAHVYQAPGPQASVDVERAERSSRVKAVSRILQFEGPRGHATRASVYVRHVVYFLTVVIASVLTEALTQNISRAGFAGKAMFFSCAFMFFIGAAGTMFYPNQRHEIIEQVRHYVFGIAVFPGLGIAVFMWASRGFLSSSNTDVFTSTVAYTLPIIFACTVLIPALVFVKTVAGMRTLHRNRMDDEEMVHLWTRQGGLR